MKKKSKKQTKKPRKDHNQKFVTLFEFLEFGIFYKKEHIYGLHNQF